MHTYIKKKKKTLYGMVSISVKNKDVIIQFSYLCSVTVIAVQGQYVIVLGSRHKADRQWAE